MCNFCHLDADVLAAIQTLCTLPLAEEEAAEKVFAARDSPLGKNVVKILVALAKTTQANRCLVCKLDIGVHNPRQLCAKTYCANL